MKIQKKVKQGKRNLINGRNFENKVRKDLEEKGWIVSRWQNNVDIKWIKLEDEKTFKQRENLLNKGYREVKINDAPTLCLSKLIPAKQGKYRKTSTGFPDFIAYKLIRRILTSKFKEGEYGEQLVDFHFEVIGVECKTNGRLSKEEKEKCKWLLENNIFSKVLIASKKKVGRKIEIKYDEVK